MLTFIAILFAFIIGVFIGMFGLTLAMLWMVNENDAKEDWRNLLDKIF